MNFYLKYVVSKKKLIIDKEKSNRLVLDKELIDVLEEQYNFPREMPKPISLSELTQYYNILWKGGCAQRTTPEKIN